MTILDISLITFIFLLIALCSMALHRVAKLEARMQLIYVNTTRELKMVNQGAIGIGRRCAMLEKNLKKPGNVANFEAIKEAKLAKSAFEQAAESVRPTPAAKSVKPEIHASGLSTRAEKALSAWINENQTA